jgi:hypothetical protein
MGADRGPVARYVDLIELAEREHELIGNRDYDGLWQLVHERDALMHDLPEVAPKDALHAIRRLLELQKRNDALLESAAAGVDVELTRLRTGRAGVRRYAPGGGESRHDFTA